MALESFFPDKKRTWAEMDEFCGAVPGKYTWPYKPILNLADMGLDLVVYNTFDSERFLDSPEEYMIERYGIEGAKNQIENSDMDSVLVQARQFLDYRNHKKILTITDHHTPAIAKDFLNKGFLVAPWVNLGKLNGREGVAGHIILIHDYKDGHFIAHDPGENEPDGRPLNQHQNRRISEEKYLEICCPKEFGKTNFLIAIRKPFAGGRA